VITDSDLRSVRASRLGDGIVLVLEFMNAAALHLETVTRDHVGSRMALLVDSRIRSAPVIEGAGGSPLRVALEVAESEEAEIVERIRARWPDSEN
jgi:preprotein translocase subunit SecD